MQICNIRDLHSDYESIRKWAYFIIISESFKSDTTVYVSGLCKSTIYAIIYYRYKLMWPANHD